VCNEEIDRVFTVPIGQDETVDFEGEFEKAFIFPDKYEMDGRLMRKREGLLVELIVTLGRRIEVDRMIAAGLLPPEGDGQEPLYKLYYVDVKGGVMIRKLTVPPSQIATTERKADALYSLLTGEDFILLRPPQPSTVDFTLVGSITAGGGALIALTGIIFALLADDENSNFEACNGDFGCRSGAGGNETTQNDALQSRNLNASVADALFISGGIIAVAGLTMILIDQLSGEEDGSVNLGEEADRITPETELSSELKIDWGVTPLEGGGFLQMRVVF